MTAPSPARERFERALADVVHVVCSRPATDAQLDEWAETVERYHERIRARPPESVLFGLSQSGLLAVTGVPAPGKVEGWSAPDQAHVVADVVFGEDAAGHPGMAHGGAVAAAFDEVLGLLWALSPARYVTSNLGIRFVAPVPLAATIVFEAREVSRHDRRVSCECTARLDGELLADATALFVAGRETSR